MIRERVRNGAAGIPIALLLLALGAANLYFFVSGIRTEAIVLILATVVAWVLLVFIGAGFFVVNPNEARVLQLFGDYAGTAKDPGLRWANPLASPRLGAAVRGRPAAAW
jgi:hypothetical protein